MKTLIAVILIVILGTHSSMAIEEAEYKTVKQDKDIEIRDYESYILAETIIKEDIEDAGNSAFRILFNYISGANKSKTKIEMTSPVSQEKVGEKIEMTSPVSQEKAEEGWAVSFMMPASYTMETIPTPTDDKVKIREVPEQRIAAIRYSGTWSSKRYLAHKKKLEEWIEKENLTITGKTVWARYDPPFKPWFMRRNEVLIPVKK